MVAGSVLGDLGLVQLQPDPAQPSRGTRRGTVRPAVSASNGSEAELSEPGDDRALGSLKSTERLFVQM